MASAGALIQLVQVTKRFDAVASGKPLPVLREIDLEIEPSQALAIIGPSGSGKSTLLNIIGTLDRPSSGQVLVDGQDLARLSDVELAKVRNRQIGFVFQSHYLLPQCTVLENVLVPTLARKDGPPRAAAEERARRLLEKVGLGDRLAHRPGQLSGGERQRVAVVRALINQPKVLLADEPTGALDRASASDLGQLLLDLNRAEAVALVVVTHALELARRFQRLFELRDGQLNVKPAV